MNIWWWLFLVAVLLVAWTQPDRLKPVLLGAPMLATFAFDVCHDVYLAAREAIDNKMPTLNAESSGKYLWRPDRMPRLAEYVCDFALAGERALGGSSTATARENGTPGKLFPVAGWADSFRESVGGCAPLRCLAADSSRARSAAGLHVGRAKASRMAMFRVYYLGGADYYAARRQMGISERTWADWADEIRERVGRELTRAGVFPPARYFREMGERAS